MKFNKRKKEKKITIPFSFLPVPVLLRLSQFFIGIGNAFAKSLPQLQLNITRADFKVDAKRYVAMCITTSTFFFIFLSAMLSIVFYPKGQIIPAIAGSFMFNIFIFLMQINYPKIVASKRTRKLDSELLPALRALLLQINSGVPLFEAINSVSQQEFGEVSKEFRKVIKGISAGVPQIEALEMLAVQNPSPYFNRSIWQVINGMKEGAPIKEVMGHMIANLTKEQVIQIERYGSQLNPFAMFYMMGAVIIPALSIVFLIVIASFISIDTTVIKIIFWSLLVFVVFFQLMFSGIIKSKRPSLLGE
jgi:archaeal flagellar protein FlaJ